MEPCYPEDLQVGDIVYLPDETRWGGEGDHWVEHVVTKIEYPYIWVPGRSMPWHYSWAYVDPFVQFVRRAQREAGL